uniref:Uncharacterized protein n=1 Tax=Arundo donax TaxID=35708 RepID=A0A0A9A6E7_ARUDO
MFSEKTVTTIICNVFRENHNDNYLQDNKPSGIPDSQKSTQLTGRNKIAINMHDSHFQVLKSQVVFILHWGLLSQQYN